MTLRRRGLLHLAGLSPLVSACGFHPLYMASGHDTDSAVARELAAINVPVMPERINQLMRQALQDHLDRFGLDVPKRYDLSAPIALSGEGVGIDPTSNVTRVRYVATTNWTLRRKDPAQALVKNGTARVLDGVNVIGSQFFAADQETDVEYRQFASTLADQVVLQIAGYFDAQREKSKG
jgi:hypothetical protein